MVSFIAWLTLRMRAINCLLFGSRKTRLTRRSVASASRRTSPDFSSRSISPPTATLPRSSSSANCDCVMTSSREMYASTHHCDRVTFKCLRQRSNALRRRRETSWIRKPSLSSQSTLCVFEGMGISAYCEDVYILYGVPGKDVSRTVKAVEVGRHHRQGRIEHALRCPAFAAVCASDRPRLAEEENLVVAHAENLAGDVARGICAQRDHEGSHAPGHQLLQALDALLLLRRFVGYRVDHSRPRERRYGGGTHAELLHVQCDRLRQRHYAQLGRAVVGLAEIADQARSRGHVHVAAAALRLEMRCRRAADV